MTRSDTKLASILRWVYSKISLNYDFFMVISGGEGVGKSRGLFLPIVDYWYRFILKVKESEIPAEAYAVELKDFVKGLKDGKKADIRGLDEAGDSIDSQNFANKLNKILYQAYTVIREKKYFTLIVLPSFFDLNPRFRRRRVKLLFHVYKRVDNNCKDCGAWFVEDACPKCGSKTFIKGFVRWKVYGKRQIREILIRNQFSTVKTLNVGVSPICYGRTYEYKKGLCKRYGEMKKAKMTDALERVYAEVEGLKGKQICRHTFRYVKSENSWYCIKCGYKTDESPYKSKQKEEAIT